MGEEKTRGGINDVFTCGPVQSGDRCLFLGETGGLVPRAYFGFDLLACRPPEPGLLPVGANGRIARRIGADCARVPCVEHVPAGFLSAAGSGRTPVDGV